MGIFDRVRAGEKSADKTPKVDLLPNTLSGLLRVAVEDVRACEADNRQYVVDMRDWHRADADRFGRCSVCAAGAVMSRRLGVSSSVDSAPGFLRVHYGWPESTRRKLLAIDHLRTGNVVAALLFLDPPMWQSVDFARAAEVQKDCKRIVESTSERNHALAFYGIAEKLIARLEEVGL